MREQHRTLAAPEATVRAARRLRKDMTLPEVLVWHELRKRPGGFKFRRQHPIGDLVLDFVCLERRVAIEIDGFAHDCSDRPQRDERRDALLLARGFAVLRIPAATVLKSIDDAIAAIVAACDEQLPLHHRTMSGGPPPRSGEVFRNTP